MKPLSQLEYQQIELVIPEQPAIKYLKWLKAWIVRRLEAVGRSLTHHFSLEIQVWCTYDHHGRAWWSAYDPITQRSVSHLSQEQMLIWIEQRYYTLK